MADTRQHWMCVVHMFIGIFIAKYVTIASTTASPMNTSFIYNYTTTTWGMARDYCASHSFTFPSLVNATADSISQLKRQIGIRRGDDIWSGDYKTFDVMVHHNRGHKNLTDRQCVVATFTRLLALSGSVEYGFNLTASDCSQLHKVACKCQYGGNRSTIYFSQTSSSEWLSADGTCQTRDAHCSLWVPDYSLYDVVVGERIGHATVVLGGTPKFKQFGEQYWINMLVEERYGPVYQHLFECGYISYSKPRVLYGPCVMQKGFICESEMHESGLNNTGFSRRDAQTTDALSTSAYVGMAVAAVVLIGVGCLAAWVWIRRRNNNKQDPEIRQAPVQTKPHGGRSFKPAPTKAETEHTGPLESPTSKRLTNYVQINPDDIQDGSTGTSRTLPYASVKLSHLQFTNSPEVMDPPQYLPMDGHTRESSDSIAEDDGTYDQLCHSIRENGDFEESTNVYGTASGSYEVPEYSSTIDRKSSRKALMDYDHVAASHVTESMNNRVCQSEEVYYNSIENTMALHNPGYEKMEIA